MIRFALLLVALLAFATPVYSDSESVSENTTLKVYVWCLPRPFPDVKTFRKWYYATLPDVNYGTSKTCRDYAGELVELAYKDGWQLHLAPVNREGEIFGLYKVRSPHSRPHVGTWAEVDGAYYYAESNPGEYRLVEIVRFD